MRRRLIIMAEGSPEQTELGRHHPKSWPRLTPHLLQGIKNRASIPAKKRKGEYYALKLDSYHCYWEECPIFQKGPHVSIIRWIRSALPLIPISLLWISVNTSIPTMSNQLRQLEWFRTRCSKQKQFWSYDLWSWLPRLFRVENQHRWWQERGEVNTEPDLSVAILLTEKIRLETLDNRLEMEANRGKGEKGTWDSTATCLSKARISRVFLPEGLDCQTLLAQM